MTDLLSSPAEECGFPAQQYPHLWWIGVVSLSTEFVLPSGTLRIGGDAPNGLVKLSGAPAMRVVRLLDMDTGELVAQTTSAGDGTYSFTGLSSRPNGYVVWIVGGIGERGVIAPSITPVL